MKSIINHNGDLDIAKKLADLSSEVGLDAVKDYRSGIYKRNA